MAMDDTDRKLVNGMIWLVVLGALAYYIPGFGYQDQKKLENEARNRLQQKALGYDKSYDPIHPAHYGVSSDDPVSANPGTFLSDLKSQYVASNKDATNLIEQKQKISRMSFPEWTSIPEDDREPGVYFRQMMARKQNTLNTHWNAAGVECMDPSIGFGPKDIEKINIDRNKAEERLRELFIAEKIIELCISAKQREESFEKSSGLQPEAYMKIIQVTPQDSMATGPSALIPNPKYDPDEKKPTSEKFRKYNIQLWKPFIQEYPVEIKLQCDVNTFMRFLHSVRAPGQFLVIRNLEIISPFLEDSHSDNTELKNFDRVSQLEPEKKRDLQLKDEHVLVRMSASGMDFFDPTVHPKGLYENAKTVKIAPTKKSRREIKAD
jgi:hypothetical protein